jgi:Ca2+/Na+ antiporter
VVLGALPAPAGLALALVVLALYLVVLSHEWLAGLLPPPLVRWLASAVSEEEAELEAAIRPARGTWKDTVTAAAALVVVIIASATMERSASALGGRYAIPEIVVGGLVLAAVTSLPNAVAAVYLAARGRGAATLSTALNSNTLNVVAGLLLPGVIIGLGRPSGQALLITGWYIGLTALTLALAYRDHGLRRGVGILVITAYVVFTASVLASGYGIRVSPAVIAAVAALAAVAGAGLAGRSRLSHRGQP